MNYSPLDVVERINVPHGYLLSPFGILGNLVLLVFVNVAPCLGKILHLITVDNTLTRLNNNTVRCSPGSILI